MTMSLSTTSTSTNLPDTATKKVTKTTTSNNNMNNNEPELIDDNTTNTSTNKFDSTTNENKIITIPGQTDFFWSNDTEPHCIRRLEILKKYPQIKQLYGIDIVLKYQVVFVVLLQLFIAICMSTYFKNISNLLFFIIAYSIGGTCNHMLFMGLHELAHNLGFKIPKYNKYFAIFICNVPLGIPAAISFKRYHIDHHKYQGDCTLDVDIPTHYEGKIFNNTITKLFFVVFQLFFYAIRPYYVNPKSITLLELLNTCYIVCTNILLTYCTGSFRPLTYLLLSSILGGGLHPCAGHFIAEHYVFGTVTNTNTNTNTNDNNKDDTNDKTAIKSTSTNQLLLPEAETYSYYGILNYVTFNVGYHNEHHDFPYIPGRRLPKVKEIAGAEFYNHLPYHTSWCTVLYNYITKSNVTAFSRVKRNNTTTTTTTTKKDD